MSDSIARLVPGTVGTKTITMPTEIFYEVVNALRDSCGCKKCLENADWLLIHAEGGRTFPHPDPKRYDSLFDALFGGDQ